MTAHQVLAYFLLKYGEYVPFETHEDYWIDYGQLNKDSAVADCMFNYIWQ